MRAGSGLRALAALGALALLLGACSGHPRPSAAVAACSGAASDHAALARRINLCSTLVRTSAGDDLREALSWRGEAYRLIGNPALAMQDFDRALTLKADDAQALDGRGRLYLDSGDLAKAAADFAAAIRSDPGGAGGYDGRGVIERLQGDLVAAMHDANRAIELGADTPEPWADRGLVFLARRRFGLAIADFADAVRMDGSLAYAWDGAGDAFLGRTDKKGALDAYNRASTAYFELQQYPRAIAEANKALAAAPDDPTSLNNRCWTRGVGNFELDLAEADCQHSLKVRPGDADTLDSEAMVQFRKGNLDQAIAGYSAALAKNPKLAESLYMRGVAKIMAGDRDGGQSDIDDATALDASVADTFAGYGITPPSDGQAPPPAVIKTQQTAPTAAAQ